MPEVTVNKLEMRRIFDITVAELLQPSSDIQQIHQIILADLLNIRQIKKTQEIRHKKNAKQPLT